MTKHHEKNQKLRQRKRATNIKLKAKIDTSYANLGAVDCDGLGKVAALVNPVASETKQLLVPEKLDSPAELSLPKKASKKRKRKKNAIDQVVLESGPNANSIPIVDEKDSKREEVASMEPEFPFPIDPDDHCESPMDAYQDIVPWIRYIGVQIYSQQRYNEVYIYDPYYCNGAVIRHLAELGFSNVYNRKEDCYKTWAASSTNASSSSNNIVDTMDLLITNPPYSGNHIEELIQFVTSDAFHQRRKPWFLLLPQWVHKKDYYIQATTAHPVHPIHPFYLVPHKRYVYQPPPKFRTVKKSDVHKKSSPFCSMWYCWGGTATRNAALMQLSSRTCDLARSKNALRDLRRRPRN